MYRLMISWVLKRTNILLVIMALFFSCHLIAQEQTQIEKREKEEKLEKKNFKQRIRITGDFVNASLETSVSFESDNSFLTARIGLEDNLGLDKSKGFFSGSALWRITYRSGMYFNFYRIHRRKVISVNEDLPYLGEIVPAGTELDLYFNTNVISLGYIFTVVSDAKSFLGAYANVYLMNLRTGVKASGDKIEENVKFLAPLPNFGLIVHFQVTNWMDLSGRFGMFYLSIDDFSGRINDVGINAGFRVTDWMNVNLGYKIFDVSLLIYEKDIKTILEYNFRGPSIGIALTF